MGRKKFRYNPVPFDKIISPPSGVKEGLLKEGDIVYKGSSPTKNLTYIYTKEGISLGLVNKNSLEKIK
jgi:hypothetical protein